MFTKATRDQFEFESDLKVRHKPTGATFSTHRYADPRQACSMITQNLGRAGERLESGEDYNPSELREIAIDLLRERAMATAK